MARAIARLSEAVKENVIGSNASSAQALDRERTSCAG